MAPSTPSDEGSCWAATAAALPSEAAATQGFAYSEGEKIQGARGISAPIFDAGGLAVACLVLTIPMIRFLPGSREDLGALTRQRALAVAHVLGYEAAAASAATP